MDRLASCVEQLLSKLPQGSSRYPLYRQEGWEPSRLPVLEYVLFLHWSVYLFETLLDIRQRQRLKATKPPTALTSVLKELDQTSDCDNSRDAGPGDQCKDGSSKADTYLGKVMDKFVPAQKYGLDKANFGLISGVYDSLELMTHLLLGYMPFLWDFSTSLAIKCGLTAKHEVSISLIFLFLTTVVDIVIKLPWSLYGTFVIEERHGFNKQTLGLFFADKVKSLALTAVIGGPVMSVFLWLLGRGGDLLVLKIWLLLFAIQVLGMTIYPVLIAPLFNKYSPLEEGPLRTEIEKLAGRVSFPLTKLFVVDGSKRSAHSNAYFYGFFKNKRIVLYDTLIKQMDTPEIVAILGHELGHWKMWHTLQGFVISQAYMLIMFGTYSAFRADDRDLCLSFGFTTRAPLIGLLLFSSVVWAPVDHIISFAMNLLSRRNEFQADRFSVGLGYAQQMKTGLVKMQLENLGNMNPDPWYSTYHYSHPPLVERLQGIIAADKKAS